MNARAVRQAAGVAVLVAAVGAMGALSVPYWENRAFGDELAALVSRNSSSGWTADQWRRAAMDVAARRGVRAEAPEIRVESRPAGPRIEVRYQKNVDLFVYTVRLHLRAKSGS